MTNSNFPDSRDAFACVNTREERCSFTEKVKSEIVTNADDERVQFALDNIRRFGAEGVGQMSNLHDVSMADISSGGYMSTALLLISVYSLIQAYAGDKVAKKFFREISDEMSNLVEIKGKSFESVASRFGDANKNCGLM